MLVGFDASSRDPANNSWTGPHHFRKGHISGGDDHDSTRPISSHGDFQPVNDSRDRRTPDIMRRCESTMIPGPPPSSPRCMS